MVRAFIIIQKAALALFAGIRVYEVIGYDLSLGSMMIPTFTVLQRHSCFVAMVMSYEVTGHNSCSIRQGEIHLLFDS